MTPARLNPCSGCGGAPTLLSVEGGGLYYGCEPCGRSAGFGPTPTAAATVWNQWQVSTPEGRIVWPGTDANSRHMRIVR